MKINKEIVIILATLIAIFLLFELTNIDMFVQRFFYDDSSHKWLLSHEKGSWLDIVFYTGIKKSIIIFAVIILFLYLYSFKKSAKNLREYRSGLLIVWLSVLIVPSIIGILKATTNVPCPCDSIYFGGNYPYIRVFDSMPQEIIKKFKCYPAGHASGGFALMSLYFLFKSKRNKIISITIALAIGWSMGIYKMLIGHHYLSHTIITMLLAWLLIIILEKIINKYCKL